MQAEHVSTRHMMIQQLRLINVHLHAVVDLVMHDVNSYSSSLTHFDRTHGTAIERTACACSISSPITASTTQSSCPVTAMQIGFLILRVGRDFSRRSTSLFTEWSWFICYSSERHNDVRGPLFERNLTRYSDLRLPRLHFP